MLKNPNFKSNNDDNNDINNNDDDGNDLRRVCYVKRLTGERGGVPFSWSFRNKMSKNISDKI